MAPSPRRSHHEIATTSVEKTDKGSRAGAGGPRGVVGGPTGATLVDAPRSVLVGQHRIRFLRDGTSAFPAMLDAIARAREEVLLEMYWFSGDRVGTRFRDALAERAAAGVHVRLVFDAVGSWQTPAIFWAPLASAGAQILQFHPISPLRRLFRLGSLHRRDHRKILIVDGEVGFTGGVNIGEQWAPPDAPEHAFRDDAIEIRGPAVQGLRTSFFETCRHCGRAVTERAPLAAAPDDGLVQVLTNRIGLRPDRAIRRAYLRGIRRATRSVDIASAYFLPGPIFLHAMRAAASRGVRVRLLLPERSDLRFVDLATQSLIGRLLASGVLVYAYMPRVLHSKTAVFDGRFTMIGSHNLDTFSWRYDLECDVLVDSAELARGVEDAFEADLLESRALDLPSWRRRPLGLRALAWFAGLFRAFL